MGIEATVSQAALEAFAEDGTVNGSDCQVIVDRSVEYADEEGNVRFIAALVHVVKSAFPYWSPGDRLQLDSGDVHLHQKLYDDGFITRIEAVPVGNNKLYDADGNPLDFADGTPIEHV